MLLFTGMHKTQTIKYSLDGKMPPHGNLSDAEVILAFPFGYRSDSEGNYKEPGTTNEALADFIATNPVLREMDIILSEELADAINGRMKGDTTLLSNFEQGNTSTTYGYAEKAKLLAEINDIGKIAVVAFRFHLPRATAGSEKVGFKTVVPELRQVGDFDPQSAQWWTRSRKLWAAREAAVLPASIVKKQI